MTAPTFARIFDARGIAARSASPNDPTAGVVSMPRDAVNGSATIASGSLYLTHFTPAWTEPVGRLAMISGSTAAGATPTLVRVAVYAIATSGAGTLMGATANDTGLFSLANTRYERVVTTPFTLEAGKRYAAGVLVVSAAALPSFMGSAAGGGANLVYDTAPRLTSRVQSLTDVPATLTAAQLAGITGARMYVEALP